MTNRMPWTLATFLFGVGCACAVSEAQITALWQRIPITPAAIADDPLLAEMQCWDLKGTTTGDWAITGLRAQLASGQFYNHPFGGNLKPNASLIFLRPGLEFDTYITAPSDGYPGQGAPSILGGFPDGQPISMSGSLISITCADLVVDPPGTYQLARLTFPLGVIPNVINIADVGPDPSRFSNTRQVTPDATVEIPDIPEPTCFGVIVGATMSLRRHRR